MAITPASEKDLKKLAEESEWVSVFEHDPPLVLRYPGKPNHGWVYYGKIIGSRKKT